jgi:hypothetical protein
MSRPSSLIRLQKRTAPIHPQSEGIYYQNPPKKKYQEIYSEKKDMKELEWEEEEEAIPSSAPPPFNPYKTQVKRAERKIISKEATIRQENSPCINDLLSLRTKILREKEIESKWDQKRIKQNEIISKLEQALGSRGHGLIEHQFLDVGAPEGDDENDDEAVDYDDENEATAEFKERAIFIKERRYVAGRCSAKLHQPMTKFQIYRLAMRVYWSLTSTRDKPVSQILPWMFLGSKTAAANLNYLLTHGFTHILNVTKDVSEALTHPPLNLSSPHSASSSIAESDPKLSS